MILKVCKYFLFVLSFYYASAQVDDIFIDSLIKLFISFALDKLHFTRLIVDPESDSSSLSISNISKSLASKIKSQPAFAKVTAVALPIPLVAPVMYANFNLFCYLR